jgi:hypothetical protein
VQARYHPIDAIDPALALLGQEQAQAGCLRLDEIPEHVKVDLVADGGNLDARHERDPGSRTRVGSDLAGVHRIVVGDAQHGDAGRGRAGDEFRRAAAAV